jgi:amino acid transporter
MTLERALKTRDIVLFNVAAIVGMRWVALAAANGPSSLLLWVLAAFMFFIPQGFAVISLASAVPEEGGLYVWTSRAFGARQGFLVGWLYWASNVLYFPTLTLTTAVFALYVFGLKYAALEQSAVYITGASLTLLGAALLMNLFGLKGGRWLQNIGGLATWLPAIALAVVGVVALTHGGSATPITMSSLMPQFSRLPTILFFASLCFGFAGLELAPMMAGEVVDPRRTFPRAIVISGITIAACYLIGTICLMWAMPTADTSIISGVNQAIATAGTRQGLAWLGPPVALIMAVGGLGAIGAWLIGSSRLLFVGGLDRLLPEIMSRTHPRWKTPYVALIVQAALSALFIVAATQGDSVRSAYQKLVNATLIVYFIPYVYMFAAAMKLRSQIAASEGAIPVPGGAAGSVFWNGLGLLTTLIAIVLALIPPADTNDKTGFLVQVLGGSVGFVAVGLILYALAARRGRTG